MSEANQPEPVPSKVDDHPVRQKRGIRKKFLIGLGLLFALALGFNAVQSWRASTQLESRLAKLREQGAALTLDELQAERLADDDNAQTWIRRAKPHTEALDKLLRDYQEAEEFQTFRPTDEQIEMLEKAFEEHAEAFELYEKAASCSGFQSDWRIGEQPSESLRIHLDEVSEARSIMRHCSARAGLLMAHGNFDEALQLGLQMLKFSRIAGHQPMVLGYLVSLACRSVSLEVITAILERASLTDEQRVQIDQGLAECESVESFRHALASERIYGLAAFRSEIFGGTLGSMLIWKFKIDACDYLELIGQMDDWAARPRYSIAGELELLADRKVGMLTKMSLSALLQIRHAHDRGVARVRCVRLLNALQNQFPDGIPDQPLLSELSGAEDTRLDPFSGEPLVVRVAEEDIVVYSVGINGTDEVGQFDDQADEGIRIKLR
jgi:hypothetical protein